LNPDFRDMLFAFSDEGVEFLIVGAYAMGAHGYARATGDIDLWVRRSPENAARVMRALIRFRAPLFNLTLDDLNTPDVVFQIGAPPRRIDILTSISGVEFDDAWPNRVSLVIEGRTFHAIGRAELIQNKKATGRPKDQIDALWLEKPTP
jgi:hypothetical protein